MTLKARLEGVSSSNELVEQSMHTRGRGLGGAVVYAERLLNFDPEVHPFLNPTLGNSMKQNVSFGSVAVTIHDGGTSANGDSGTADTDTTNHVIQAGQNFSSTVVVGSFARATNTGHVTAVADTDLTCDADICPDGNEAFTIDAVWTGLAVQGTWDFAAFGGKITLSSGNDNDEAMFSAHANARYDWANFTALTGTVNLDTYDPSFNDFSISFQLNGVLVGNAVSLNSVINPLDFSDQNLVISKATFGLSDGDEVNELQVLLDRSGGPKPDITFDDLQLEASGDPVVFKATTPKGTRFHISELRIAIAENVSGITTVAGATENATVPNLDHSTLLGVTVSNGIIFSRVSSGVTIFSVTFRDLGDFLASGSNLINHISDGTNTFITLLVEFPEPIILDGTKEDFLSFTIQDNLESLRLFTAVARGAIEV